MEELDLKELFNIFWNKKLQVILIIAIFVVIGIIYTIGFVEPVYESSTTLVLAKSEDSNDSASDSESITQTDVTLNQKLVATYSEIVKSKKVRRKVISNLEIDMDEEELKKNVSVTSVEDTEVIKIIVKDKNPTNAAKIANEIAKVFPTEVSSIYKINNVYILDEAEVAQGPSNINHVRDIVIFAFIGLVISFVYVLVGNMFDTTVKTVEDIEKSFKIPVLVSIPVYNFDSEKGGKKRK